MALVNLTRIDELALVTLDRPQALNALSFELLGELREAFAAVAASDARALLVTGAGERAFCAGADITELMGRPPDKVRDDARSGQGTFAMLDTLKMPSIALINGFALGGGLELALACTLRLASPKARLGLPEIKLGLTPGYGGTQRLPRLIGPAAALDMILTGRMVGAEEAVRLGLVNRLADGDLLEAGLAYARELTGYSLKALRLARDAVLHGLDLPLPDALSLEADINTAAFQTADATEGMTAFLEKRQPGFRDA